MIIDQVVLIETSEAGFGLQEYMDCLKEHRGKNTIIFIEEGWLACPYGPNVVFPDYTVRWYEAGKVCGPNEWAEVTEDLDKDMWELEIKKHHALLLLTYNQCADPHRLPILGRS